MLNQEQIENYSSLSIKKLENEIRKKGFTYRLIRRENHKFIYSQHSRTGKITSYEVFLNKLSDNHKAKSRWAKLQNKDFNIEDHEKFYEVFPSDEEFGKRAWTYPDLESAMKIYLEI